jgi:hypothetical protein
MKSLKAKVIKKGDPMSLNDKLTKWQVRMDQDHDADLDAGDRESERAYLTFSSPEELDDRERPSNLEYWNWDDGRI